MPISVTCQCGARLEIDEKFLGKEIPCPDCQRPLPTKAPAAPPPLELPDYRRTSGLAVLSLTLALVGAFTLVGTLAAIAVGILALKEIAGKANKPDGINFARAGIILGAVFTFVTLASMVSPTVFGLDVFLREMALASRLQYPASAVIKNDIINDGTIKIQRPAPAELWGVYTSSGQQTANVESDLLILVNVREDAYISCQSSVKEALDDDPEALEKQALARFHKSELVNLLGRTKGKLASEGKIVEKKPLAADGTQEIILDIRLGGIERRCLLLYSTEKNQLSLNVFVGCARRSRFERMQEDFRKAYTSLEVKF
jgi:hypothetical protein